MTEGTVTQVLPGTMFRVDLPGQRNVLAHISLRFDESSHHFSRTINAKCIHDAITRCLLI